MFYAFKSVKWHDFIYLVTGYFIMMRLELLGILLSFILLTSGLGYDVNYAEAKGDDEPCSYKHPHSFLKISNDPLECEKVDYWVPRICGIEAGLYKTSAICQHHPAPEAEPNQELIPWHLLR